MLLIAFKRLWNRPWLTLLSIVGVICAVGLVVSIPVFAKAVAFLMLQEELDTLSEKTGRPPFSIRIYVLPSSQYTFSLQDCRDLQEHVSDTISTEVGLPLLSVSRHIETTGVVIRTRDEETMYGGPHTALLKDTKLNILPGAASRLSIVDGEPMEGGVSQNGELDIWLHKTVADQMGVHPGEKLEVFAVREGIALPVRIAGVWVAANPYDEFWFQNPDMSLRRELLVRESDYERIAEPLLARQLGFISWYMILDDSQLSPEYMQEYADGLKNGFRVVERYVNEPRMDNSPIEALDHALERESDLTVLMFVFSVPVMGFLLYFLSLISSISIRWKQRETAVMVSRGLNSAQLLVVSLIEAVVVVGLGVPLGMLTGIQLARLMGYTASFMVFTWRDPLPVSITSYNLPLLLAAVSAALLARLWPVLRGTRTSVVAHERRRARAPQKPFWQRFYLDFLLLIPVAYAYRQLSISGTLVPEVVEEGVTIQDPLLFLVPALFTLTLSLLLVRLFPLLMRVGDWIFALGRQSTLYLSFRQLSRQSSQYTSALLLVITSLSLGAFMASMAVSLDQWLVDQVYYAVGSDVLIKQTLPQEEEFGGVTLPVSGEGAWVLPVESYLEIPGVEAAARMATYPASISQGSSRWKRASFLGLDRLDASGVLFSRPDFGYDSIGELMNLLAIRDDAILISSRALEQGNYAIGDQLTVRVNVVDVTIEATFTIAGTYEYFPTVYEQETGRITMIGNLNFLFNQVGATMLHNIWLKTAPDADPQRMTETVEGMGVNIARWIDAREEIATEQAQVERVGIFGTLTIGFLAAAVLSGIGLLVYNYASLRERLFRFTILRAVGLSLLQVVSQVTIEYLVLMVYSVAGGTAIGIAASKLFIPFFQAADKNILRPPTMIPLIAWQDIGRISGAFTIVLVLAQVAVIVAALRSGVFQALRMGDQE